MIEIYKKNNILIYKKTLYSLQHQYIKILYPNSLCCGLFYFAIHKFGIEVEAPTLTWAKKVIINSML